MDSPFTTPTHPEAFASTVRRPYSSLCTRSDHVWNALRFHRIGQSGSEAGPHAVRSSLHCCDLAVEQDLHISWLRPKCHRAFVSQNRTPSQPVPPWYVRDAFIRCVKSEGWPSKTTDGVRPTAPQNGLLCSFNPPTKGLPPRAAPFAGQPLPRTAAAAAATVLPTGSPWKTTNCARLLPPSLPRYGHA